MNTSRSLLLIAFAILIQSANAYHKTFTSRLLNPALAGDTILVKDDKNSQYVLPNWYTGFNNLRVKNNVFVRIDRNNLTFVPHKCTLRVVLSADYNKFVPNTMGLFFYHDTRTVDLVYDTAFAEKEVDEAAWVIDDAVNCLITITSITAISGPPGVTYPNSALPVLEAQQLLEVDRIGDMSLSPLTISPPFYSTPDFVTLSWTSVSEAEAYELEYLHVPDGFNIWSSPAPNVDSLFFDFRQDATNVIVTSSNSIVIPNIWARGYVVYRVRALGKKVDEPDRDIHSLWSVMESGTVAVGTGTSTKNFVFKVLDYNDSVNWQFTNSFAEETKLFSSMGYFDGTMRFRQSVIKNNTTGIYTVSQTLYDNLGRQSARILPAPVLDNNYFTIRTGVNKNASGNPYSFQDFDLNKTSSDEINVNSFSNASGAGYFYSSELFNNSALNSVATLSDFEKYMHGYVPDAEGFPMMQTEFRRDNTGRVYRSGGAGKTHQLTAYHDNGASLVQGKETYSWDGTPTQEELDVLFGNDVGYYQFYKKIMSRDANGQLSVAYLDPYGRTIATALAGNASDAPNMDPIATSSNYLKFDLYLKNSRENAEDRTKMLVHHLLVSQTDTVKFYYDLYRDPVHFTCDSLMCFDCAYDMTISIQDALNKEMIPDGPITQFIGTLSQSGVSCSDTVHFSISPNPLALVLAPGEYTVNKTLTISNKALAYYRKLYFDSSNCITPFQDFLTDAILDQGITCDWGCEDCDSAKAELAVQMNGLRTYAIANSIDTSDWDEFLALKSEINETDSFCDILCKDVSPCEQLLYTLLEDMSPGGQYAQYAEYDSLGLQIKNLGGMTDTNVLKDSGKLYCRTGSTINYRSWRTPKNPDNTTYYLNEDGTEDLIEVVNGYPQIKTGASYVTIGDKQYARPHELKYVADFLDLWEEQWANSLIYMHPEYCYYKACQEIEPLYEYEQKLLNTSSASDAMKKGYYNPLGLSGTLDTIIVSGTSHNLNYSSYEDPMQIDRDPITAWSFYHSLYPGGVISRGQALADSLEKYRYKSNVSGACQNRTASIWKIYERARLGQGLSLGVDTCADNLMWPLLRALYLSRRNEWIKTYYDSTCSHKDTCPYNYLPIKERRWVMGMKPKDMGIDNEYMDGSFFSDLETKCALGDFNGAVDDVVEKNCQNYCEANASDWMAKLSRCPSIAGASQARKDSIYDALVHMCMGGCDFNNPYGSVNVSYDNYANTAYPDKDVNDVLIRFRVYLIPGICDDLLINFPGEYGHDYLATSDPDADTCACSKYKQIRISGRCGEDTTGNVASKDCGCSYSNADLKNAIVSSHGVDENQKCQNCITCNDLLIPVTAFCNRYESFRDSMLADTSLYQAILTNSLNRYFGFNLTYEEYHAYAMNCLDSTILYGSWLRAWEIIGTEKLVSYNDPIDDYSIRKANMSPAVRPFNSDLQGEILQPIKLAYENWNKSNMPEMLASSDNVTYMAAVSSADADNIACHCERILNVKKLIEDGQNSGMTGENLYDSLYGPPFPFPYLSTHVTFDSLSHICCRLKHQVSHSSACSLNDFTYGDKFSEADKTFIDGELTSPPLPNPYQVFIDPPQPCMSEPPKDNESAYLDTCSCKKLKQLREQWDLNHHGLTYPAYILQQTGVTANNLDSMNSFCEELWKTGVKKNRDGTPVSSYSSTEWWRDISTQNLRQHAIDFNAKVPKELACITSVGWIDYPCEDYINCASLRMFLFGKMILGDHDGLGIWNPGAVEDYIDILASWDHDYPEGGSYTPGSEAAKRRAFLDALKDEMNAITQNDKCDASKVYSLDEMLKVAMNCGDGDGVGCFTTRPGCGDLAKDILDFNKLLDDAGSPVHTYFDNSTDVVDSIPDLYKMPAYSRVDYILKRYNNYWWKSCNNNLYFRYSPSASYGDPHYLRYYHTGYSGYTLNSLYDKPCTQVGNLDMDDSMWLAGFEYYINNKYNSCFSTTPQHLYSYLYFYLNFTQACPRPKIAQGAASKPPCDKCYIADTSWLSNFTTFLNQVTQKNDPDYLHNSEWYLQPSMGSSDYYFSNFYANPVLYNGANAIDLTYELSHIDVPELVTDISDGAGYHLKFSLSFPNSNNVWNFSHIVKFISPRARKSGVCGSPRYFYIDAVYDVPDKYESSYPGCPNSVYYMGAYTKCYDTVTLIGEIINNTNNRSLGLEVACLGCKKLCNKPYTRNDYVDSTSRCSDIDMRVAFSNALSAYNSYIKGLINTFDSNYLSTCMAAREIMRLKYNNRQYHHTLYYYDQAGNLIKTVPPMGVDIDNENINQTERQKIADDRIAKASAYRSNNSNPYALTYHSLISNFKYNTLSELVEQITPDGGNSHFWYDPLGRSVILQNSKQIGLDKYSYTGYDYLGRAIESGELDKTADTHAETDLTQDFEEARDTTVASLNSVIDGLNRWDALTSDSRMSLERYNGYRGIKLYHQPCTSMYCIIGQVSYRMEATLAASTAYTVNLDETLLGGLSAFDVNVEYQTTGLSWTSLGVTNISSSGSHAIGFTMPGAGSTTGKARFTISFTPGAYSQKLFLNSFEVEHNVTGIQTMSFAVSTIETNMKNFILASTHHQVTKSFYNQMPLYSRAYSSINVQNSNLRGRVGGLTFEEDEDNDSTTYDHAYYYSYDIHGNIKRLVQDIPALDFLGKNIYTLDHYYDIIGGITKEIVYQGGQSDRFFHRFTYDRDNRLTNVYTGRDSAIWDEDARYFYYLTGSLMRTELGELKVQGIDYAYTINGWLKAVNGPVMHYMSDMGNDGGYYNINLPGGSSTSNPHRYVARDAMAFYLSYFEGDYKASSNTGSSSMNAMQPVMIASDPSTQYRSLYNGNIAMMGTSLPDRTAQGTRTLQGNIMGNVYHYDQLNRLTSHYTFNTQPSAMGATWSWTNTGANGTTAFYEHYVYDGNGNIRTQQRNGENATTMGSLDMDDHSYKYDLRNRTITVGASSITLKELQDNKLWHINDAVSSGGYSTDIDDQFAFVAYPGNISSDNNYRYDEIGNLIYDSVEQIAEIKWNVHQKITEIIRLSGSSKPDLMFGYDAAGFQLYKTIITKTGGVRDDESKWTTQYYVRDLYGEILSTYTLAYKATGAPNSYKAKFRINEWMLKGDARLGLMKIDSVLVTRDFTANIISNRFDAISYTGIITNYATQDLGNMVFTQVHGRREYELSNHLGNALVSIQDRKLAKNDGALVDYYEPYVISVTDYYAYGSVMQKRSYNKGESYKFGFNSMQKDDEVYGSNNDYDAEYRSYDPRIGRWMSRDPKWIEYQPQSPYCNNNDNPVFNYDINGDNALGAAAVGFLVGGVSEYSSQFWNSVAKNGSQKDEISFKEAFHSIDYCNVLISAAVGTINGIFPESSTTFAFKGLMAGTSALLTAGLDYHTHNDEGEKLEGKDRFTYIGGGGGHAKDLTKFTGELLEAGCVFLAEQGFYWCMEKFGHKEEDFGGAFDNLGYVNKEHVHGSRKNYSFYKGGSKDLEEVALKWGDIFGDLIYSSCEGFITGFINTEEALKKPSKWINDRVRDGSHWVTNKVTRSAKSISKKVNKASKAVSKAAVKGAQFIYKVMNVGIDGILEEWLLNSVK